MKRKDNLKIPGHILRAAWIAGANASWDAGDGGKPMYTAAQNWMRDREQNRAGIKAAAEVVARWMKKKPRK